MITNPVARTHQSDGNGKERTLRTIGDKWSYLQRSKFGANAQPFYVLIDNEGKPLNKSYSYDEDIDKYVDFLQTGLQNYKNNQSVSKVEGVSKLNKPIILFIQNIL